MEAIAKLQALFADIISNDPQFAIELSVSPEAALMRLRSGLTVDDHIALRAVPRGLLEPVVAKLLKIMPAIGPEQVEKAPGGAPGGPNPKPVATKGNLPFQFSSDPPSGDGNLTLTYNDQTLFSEAVTLGAQLNQNGEREVPTFSFGEGELNGMGSLPLHRTFLQPNNPAGVEFTADVPFDWPAEAQIFARDPEELGQFADTFETNQTAVRNQVSTTAHVTVVPPGSPFGPSAVTLPDALVLLSPGTDGPFLPIGKNLPPINIGAPARVDGLTIPDFFGHDTPYWDGNSGELDFASEPGGNSSAKAARITYPGLCTLEQLYQVPQPDLTKIFDKLDNIFIHWARDITPLQVYFGLFPVALDDTQTRVTVFPLLRHNVGDRFDSRAQFYFSIETHAFTLGGPWGCSVEAAAIYDIMLDARGGLVFQIAPFPQASDSNPHVGPTNWYIHVDGTPRVAWVDEEGRMSFGDAAVFVGNHGGPLCGPFDDWIREFLITGLPHGLNKAFREVQMFPRFEDRNKVDPKKWGCNAQDVSSRPDPQFHLPATRGTYDPDVPVGLQMETGFGYFEPGDGEACRGARNDFCAHVRWGFAGTAPTVGTTNSSSTPFCDSRPGDPLALRMLLNSVNQVDAFGNLAHWGCAGTDAGNQTCQGPNKPSDPNETVDNNFVPDGGQCSVDFRESLAAGAEPKTPACLNRRAGSHVDAFGASFGCKPAISLGRCYFVPPARRMIANPDGLQIVFYDSPTDWTNPSLALRYALVGYALESDAVSGSTTFGFGAPVQAPYQPELQPLALCNYDRLNDIPSAVRQSQVDHTTPVLEYFDAVGHPLRTPYAFARWAAVYTFG